MYVRFAHVYGKGKSLDKIVARTGLDIFLELSTF